MQKVGSSTFNWRGYSFRDTACLEAVCRIQTGKGVLLAEEANNAQEVNCALHDLRAVAYAVHLERA